MSATEPADIHIIIPSAGSSSRLGGFPKQEVEFGEQKLWQHRVHQCLALKYPTTLVTGYWQPDEADLAKTLKTEQAPLLELLPFNDWSQGLGASIAHAVAKTKQPKLGYLIVLSDQWGLTASALERFISSWDGQSMQIATDEDYSGPPALIPVRYFKQLCQLTGERGAKKLIQSQQPKRVKLLHASWDLDTEEDLYLMQQVTQQSRLNLSQPTVV